MRLIEITSNLPMDTASRMRRAKELGFTIRAYHGTGANFKAFDLDKGNPHIGMGYAPYFSTVKAEAKGYADERAEQGLKTRVLDVLLRVKNPLIISYMNSPISTKTYEAISGQAPEQGDEKYTQIGCTGYNALRTLKDRLGEELGWQNKRDIWTRIYRHLKALGYDALFDPDTPGDHHAGYHGKIVVFDPKNIRSTKARFDPAKSESSNLMD